VISDDLGENGGICPSIFRMVWLRAGESWNAHGTAVVRIIIVERVNVGINDRPMPDNDGVWCALPSNTRKI
jgi:hypothetical protein